ncbi:positive transcriptional regulator for purine utilization [Fusarium albosuccineum]|uniref:Positive transcriptional regulator for purine utilization n=1 Tax=Fusarium albosuccineum TaxID=1237068 RepID=A0A8H4LQ96_9HYPO|nr:positive transcriptional regulator for purine utilization [Fusarium albosuccineum]
METSSPVSRKRTSVRRANVTACLRCKSRKQRCDQSIPACSSCARAGVPCVSVDTDGRSAPRSYIKSLEDRVAQLELALRSHGVETESVSDGQPSQEAWSTAEAASEPQQPSDLTLLRLLVPDPQHIQDRAAPGYHALLDDISVPSTVKYPPKPTAVQLAATYFEHSNFFSPILDEEQFQVILDGLYHNELGPEQGANDQKFQLCMVLAIAIRLLNRTDAAVPTTGSDSFFASAIAIFTERPHAIWKGGLEHLQNLLLIVQYTIFTSNLSAAWHFIGLATRLAIDLDLHNEPQAGSRPEDHRDSFRAEIDKKRRIFWSTYILETNLCVVLHRPRSIPDEAIFTPLPSTDGPESSSPLANHCILFRQLEYEIFQKLNYKAPNNGAIFDYHDWKVGMRDRLLDWHNTVPPVDITSKLAPRNFFDGALYMTLVNLFSPSRNFPTLSEGELRDLARYASQSVEEYRAGFREGKLRFYWRTIPNLFQSGAALVHCIKSLTLQGAAFDRSELEKRVTMCSTVLWAMAERYPPGASYRDRFDELSSSISDVSNLSHGLASDIPQDFFFASDVIAPLDLDGTATLWTSTPPNLDPWVFDQS